MIDGVTGLNAPLTGDGQVNTLAISNIQDNTTAYRYQTLASFLGETAFGSPMTTQLPTPTHTAKTPQPNNISSPVTVSSTLADSEYDEGNMRRLETMMAQFNTLDLEDSHDPALYATSLPAAQTPDYGIDSNAVGGFPGFEKECSARVNDPTDYGKGLNEIASYSAKPRIEVNYVPSPVQDHNRTPTPPTYRLSRPIEDDGPIVRLTQAVYASIMAQISTLQKEKAEALKRIGVLQRELHERTEGVRDVSGTVGKLHYQLEANKDYKAAMGRDIRQRDIQLYKADLQIDSLKAKVADMDAMQKKLERLTAEVDYLRISKTTEETSLTRLIAAEEEIARVTAIKDKEIARITVSMDKEIARIATTKDKTISHQESELEELKTAATRSQSVVSDHATRAQNLVDTQAQREKKIKQLQEKLLEEMDTNNTLRDEIEVLRESLPSQNKLDKMQEELRCKTSDLDRQRNENKTLNQLYARTQKHLTKVQDESKSLKGAAHLIIPLPTTRLPKLVFPCMECFLKNIDCDAQSRCHNCIQGDEQCSRWRCALRHVSGSCNQVPCRFVHDVNGWLVANGPRPKW